jgi:hypothetical protein
VARGVIMFSHGTADVLGTAVLSIYDVEPCSVFSFLFLVVTSDSASHLYVRLYDLVGFFLGPGPQSMLVFILGQPTRF